MNKLEALKKYFNYTSFKEPQEKIIDAILDKRDTIAILPTGFGKSICFQIPALLLEGLSIVITPLIALMVDQVEHLRKNNIPSAVLHSDMTEREQEKVYEALNRNEILLLYVSAERLLNPYFIKRIKSKRIPLIIIDEAHTILWGESFREAFLHIAEFIALFPKRPVVSAFTATATSLTITKIKSYLKLVNPCLIQMNVDRPNIYYRVEMVKNKRNFLLNYLKKHSEEKGIIYCLTRKRVEELADFLKKNGIRNTYYHGGLDVDLKEIAQGLFIRNTPLMICTNAFGMGIDIPDIRFVLHYEIPCSLEDLAQQMGRAARDGKYAEGVVLFSYEDISIIKYFIEGIEDKEIKKQEYKKLDSLISYCLSKRCRHQLISTYFGQSMNACKCFCDNCRQNYLHKR